MNICVFSPHFGGGYGAGYSTKKEADQLLKMGHRIFVIHSESNIDHYRVPGIEYFYFRYSKLPAINIFILKRDINRLLGYIMSANKIDLLYAQSLEFGLVNKKLLKQCPIVYFARSTIKGVERNKAKEFWIDSIRRKFIVPILIYLESKCIGMSDAIIVKSNIMKRELIKLYKADENKVEVIRGGIDREDFPQMSKEEIIKFKKRNNIIAGEKIILFAGRISPVKGLIYLIKAVEGIIRSRQDIKLLIVGKSMMSRYYKKIEKLFKNANLNKFIVFIGYIPQNEMYKYFNISDVVVAPSTYEPFGMVDIQALILNKPLITTNITGSVEIMGDNSLVKIINPRSPNEIEETLLEVLNKPSEKAEAGEFEINELSWGYMADKIETLFKKVIHLRHATSQSHNL